ncbi:MAG: hypothetical protein U0V49_10185 [Saprospiraceae bacterium]
MSSTLLIAIFAFLLVVTVISFVSIYTNLKRQNGSLDREQQSLRLSYDQIRLEKLQMEERYQQAINLERTYKVAFEDWKSKYDLLEIKYNALKKDFEQQRISENKSEPVAEIVNNSSSASEYQHHSAANEIQLSEFRQLSSDIRNILNQHLEILSKLVHDVDLSPNSTAPKSDPLHLIMGIDEDVSAVLQNQGIRTFDQLVDLPRKEIKKLVAQFDEIDERLVESWPLQAGAIIRAKQTES